MKRLHVHISVPNLDRSIGFYSTLFGTEPKVVKDDYAKWMLDDPAVNFAISTHGGGAVGIDHLGIQTDDSEALQTITARLKSANESTFDQEATTCCYAVSDKTWVEDPSGVRWETFYTHGEATTYGADASKEALPGEASRDGACCG